MSTDNPDANPYLTASQQVNAVLEAGVTLGFITPEVGNQLVAALTQLHRVVSRLTTEATAAVQNQQRRIEALEQQVRRERHRNFRLR